MHAAFLHFLPPETMGAHVGPERGQTTGRAADMALRTLSAAFGHLGVEADVTALPPADAQHLQQAIAAYKDARAWLADAEVSAIDAGDPALMTLLAVAADGSQAWLSIAATERRNTALPGLLRVPGLTPRRVYDIQAHSMWLAQGLDLKRGGCLDRGEPVTLDAGTLSSGGLRLPALRPGTGCLLVLRGR